jgi:uncharacterized protein
MIKMLGVYMSDNEIYKVRDPIYGFIAFNEWERDIISHPAFQRLRRIRQLGTADMVYPGAVHTRFEHSLGVMNMATLMYEAIKNNDKNEILKKKLHYRDSGFERERQLVRLAALLHDIGHAPFSHASESIFPLNDQGREYTHEDYTAAIIKGPLKSIIETHQFNERNYGISANDVAALIEGNPSSGLGKRVFWKVLISSQLDADRGDYLLRDSHHVGVKYGIYDHLRLINTLSLGIEPESEEIVLGINENGWHVAESLVIARYQMFTQVYFHKTVRAYQYHLEEAMKASLVDGKMPGPEALADFIRLDDTDMWNLFKDKYSSDDNCKSILDRNHIRRVYHTPEKPTPSDETLKDQMKQKLTDHGIWVHEDNKAKKTWYTLNDENEKSSEIMIIKAGRAIPLSNYSLIVMNMKGINQIRLYVKPDDRAKAEELLNE